MLKSSLIKPICRSKMKRIKKYFFVSIDITLEYETKTGNKNKLSGEMNGHQKCTVDE